MKKIVIIGECMIELNGEPFGKMWQAYGGDTLNTATYLARLSRRSKLDVCYLSAMGNDNLSSAMIEKWQQDGINTDWVLRDPTRQAGLYLIQLDKQGSGHSYIGATSLPPAICCNTLIIRRFWSN